jgi:hypothetical protein
MMGNWRGGGLCLNVMYVSSSSLSSSFSQCLLDFLLSPSIVVRCFMRDERRLTGSHIKTRSSVVIKSFHRITTSTSPKAGKVEVEVARVVQVTEMESR